MKNRPLAAIRSTSQATRNSLDVSFGIQSMMHSFYISLFYIKISLKDYNSKTAKAYEGAHQNGKLFTRLKLSGQVLHVISSGKTSPTFSTVSKHAAYVNIESLCSHTTPLSPSPSLTHVSLLTTRTSAGNSPSLSPSVTPTYPCKALSTVFSSELLVYLLSKLNT